MIRTYCNKGHLLTNDNLSKSELLRGKRVCRTCLNERARLRSQRPDVKQVKNAWQREQYQLHREEILEKNRKNWHKHKNKYLKQKKEAFPETLRILKTEVLKHYGNNKLACVCCGVDIIQFLTLDHINGRQEGDRGSNKNKKVGRSLWAYLKRENFPSGYQTLCWNCNSGRQINKGVCPHKQ